MNGLSTSNCHAVGDRKDLLTTILQNWNLQVRQPAHRPQEARLLLRLCGNSNFRPSRRQPQENLPARDQHSRGCPSPQLPRRPDRVNFITSTAISPSPSTSQKWLGKLDTCAISNPACFSSRNPCQVAYHKAGAGCGSKSTK